jgi:hypothetical protein
MYVSSPTRTRFRRRLGADTDTFYWNQDPSVGPVVTGNPQAIAASKVIAAEQGKQEPSAWWGPQYNQPTFDEVLALANAQDAANASASPAVPNILGLGLNLPSLPAGADSLSAVPWWMWGLLLGGGALLVVKVLK